MSALIYRYPKFIMIANDSAQVDALLATLTAEGELLRGRRREKLEWIGVALMETMTRCWFQAAIENRCLSWDRVIHKVLTVVLQCALCCRGGEIVLSRGYTTEFMRWGDLVMTLAPGKDTLDDILLTCTIKYEKGSKQELNGSRDVVLKTLRDPSRNTICPVKLLLIQALRSGNLSSSDDALATAARRRDRRILWLYPDRPVIPQFAKHSAQDPNSKSHDRGTYPYLAPEMVALLDDEYEEADKSADIWALGLCMFDMCEGALASPASVRS